MHNKAGEAKELILPLDCGTDESNKMEVSSCWGFFDLRLAMAAGERLDGVEELRVFCEMDSAKCGFWSWVCKSITLSILLDPLT